MPDRGRRKTEYEPNVRISLVEDDLTEHDADIADLRAELGKVKLIMIGLLVSLLTGAITVIMTGAYSR